MFEIRAWRLNPTTSPLSPPSASTPSYSFRDCSGHALRVCRLRKNYFHDHHEQREEKDEKNNVLRLFREHRGVLLEQEAVDKEGSPPDAPHRYCGSGHVKLAHQHDRDQITKSLVHCTASHL
jgi:hypothetical protein